MCFGGGGDAGSKDKYAEITGYLEVTLIKIQFIENKENCIS